MTGQEYINAALRLCGAIQPGESVAGGEANDALDTLNRMIRHFSIEFGPIFSEKLITHTLTASTFRYTIGKTEYTNDPQVLDDIQYPRPQRVISASIRRSSVDYPVKVIPWQEYETFSDKSTASGMPEYLAYNPSAPSGVIYLYPIPDAADSLRLVCQYSFQDMELATETGDVTWNAGNTATTTADGFVTKSNMDTTANDYFFPPGYDEMIVNNLALKLAPEYDVPMSKYSVIRQMAMDSKAAVVQSNFKVESLVLDPRLPNERNSWNYRTGDYYG